MNYSKYHALGNDYLVLDPKDGKLPEKKAIRCICHRNFGLGSDGILYGPLRSNKADFGLRILNPDGSEAEKSGNGLRIFARYLYDIGAVKNEAFSVDTLGGIVTCRMNEAAESITVEMGTVRFPMPATLPAVSEADSLGQLLRFNGKTQTVYIADIGNPHCILVQDVISAEQARADGAAIEIHEAFPSRTNVQFLKVINRNKVQIEIWERGAGYTLASGSSSSASAAVARRLGLVDDDVRVEMPGGAIDIHIGPDYAVRMTGPATGVARMIFDERALNWFPLP